MANMAWLSGLAVGFRDEMLEELIELSTRLQHIVLREGIKDDIVWKLSTDGKYLARSAYQMMFSAHVATSYLSLIWRVRAPLKCKFFVRTTMQNRVLTVDVLMLRGWDNDYFCPCVEGIWRPSAICSGSARGPRIFGS